MQRNNRIGKTIDVFKKIRATKGTFYAKVGTIKDRNNVALTEAEDIRRGGKNTQNCTKKYLHDPDNHDGVITHLEIDILEYEVKWALRSITTKLVEVMEFQLSYFKSWKMMLWKCCTNMPANLKNSAVATGLEKVSFHSKSQRKAMPKNVQTTAQLHSSHTPVK